METFKILFTVQKTIARYTEILIILQAGNKYAEAEAGVLNTQKPEQFCGNPWKSQ